MRRQVSGVKGLMVMAASIALGSCALGGYHYGRQGTLDSYIPAQDSCPNGTIKAGTVPAQNSPQSPGPLVYCFDLTRHRTQ